MTHLMTTADAARIFHVPESTIRRWASEGRLQALGTPRRRLYDATEIEQIVQPGDEWRLTHRRK